MSYYGYDKKGYVGDVASIGGYSDFLGWASELGGEIGVLCSDGCSNHPKRLAKELESLRADDPSAESVRKNIAKLAAKSKGVFYVGDGMS